MKKTLILILAALLFIGGIVGASALYRQLSTELGGNSQLQSWTGGASFTPGEGGTEQPGEGEGDPALPPSGEGDPTLPPDGEGDPTLPPDGEGDPTLPPDGEEDPEQPDGGGDPVLPPEEEPEPPAVFSAPDFTVLDENGNTVRLSDFLGKPIVVNFWATWCYYCKAEMADFNRAYEEFSDVQFVMVNATDGVRETVASAKKYVADNGFGFDLFFDVNGEAVHAYGITGFPSTFFINASGEPVAYATGMLDYATLARGIGMIS